MSDKVSHSGLANVGIESILGLQTQSPLQRLLSAQSFWVTVALAIMCAVMSYLQPESFATSDNFYNITRNFSFIGIMALGMTVVIATGGIDLSVGSIMGLTAVCCGLTLTAGYPWWAAIAGRTLRGICDRPHQRSHHRLCRSFAICDDARHAVDRPLGRGRAVGQPHVVQIRSRRADLQIFRRRRRAFRRRRGAIVPAAVSRRADHHSGRRLQDDGLGPLCAGDRRQRAGGAADRRAGEGRQGAGLCRLGAGCGVRGDPQRRLVGFGDQRARHDLRVAGDLGRRHRRRQSDGRRGQRLRRFHRRRAHLHHSQRSPDAGRQLQLAGNVRRSVSHRRRLPRKTPRRDDANRLRVQTREEEPC